jgi:Fe2+-dicitrate sensor, membrane component
MMKKKNTFKLLSRYASKTIKPSEWDEFRSLIEVTNDDELSDAMNLLWENTGYSQENTPSKEILGKIYNNVLKETKNKDSGRKIFRYAIRVAAVVLIAILTGISGYLYQDREYRINLGGKDVIVNVARGQKVMLTLPDSSVVYLNSESSLRYRQDFGYKDRTVSFMGEAMFEVRKDISKKFVVSTEYLNAEVLGTSFNFYAYESEDEVELALISGGVRVETKTQPVREARVKPDEKVIYNKKTGSLKLEKANIRFDTAWTRDELVFRSKPLKDVLHEIERRYGVNINVEGEALGDDRFTGYFAYKDVRDVLEELKMHYMIKYKISGDQILIFN